jgi:hypothetical protein
MTYSGITDEIVLFDLIKGSLACYIKNKSFAGATSGAQLLKELHILSAFCAPDKIARSDFEQRSWPEGRRTRLYGYRR